MARIKLHVDKEIKVFNEEVTVFTSREQQQKLSVKKQTFSLSVTFMPSETGGVIMCAGASGSLFTFCFLCCGSSANSCRGRKRVFVGSALVYVYGTCMYSSVCVC